MLRKEKCNGVWFLNTGLQVWGLYVNMVVGIKIVHRVGFLWLIYGFDHRVDHLREWTMWEQCSQEVTKAWFS